MPNIESEKKRLVKKLPKDLDLDLLPKHNIVQYYINHPTIGPSRIRSIDHDNVLITKKYNDKAVVGKVEIEREIESIKFEEYKKYIITPNHGLLEKTRYHLTLNDDLHGELDVFHGICEGIVFLEVEFDALHPYATFKKPSRVSKNITNIITNKALFVKWPSIIKKLLESKTHPVIRQIKKTHNTTKKALTKLTKQLKK